MPSKPPLPSNPYSPPLCLFLAALSTNPVSAQDSKPVSKSYRRQKKYSWKTTTRKVETFSQNGFQICQSNLLFYLLFTILSHLNYILDKASDSANH